MKYCNTSKITIERTTKDVVYNIVVNKHYANTWTASSDIYAVYYESNDHKFFDDNKKLIGCVIYGNPVGFRVVKSICKELTDSDVLELKRLWVEDGYGKNIESYCIAQTLKMLKKDSPQTKVVISYADPGANHKGIVYRACNFYYQGNNIEAKKYGNKYMYRYPNTDKWLSDRAVAGRVGTSSHSTILDKIPDIEYKRKLLKHRYLYFLCNRGEKKRLIKQLKHPLVSYA
jgi:hypothetical protein